MIKRLLFIPLIILIAFCGVKGQEEATIPSLDNPMTLQYLNENLNNSQPRLVYTPSLVKSVRKKITSEPVSGNLYKAIRFNAETIYQEPVLERIKVGKRLLSTSRELLYRINMLGFVYLMEEDERTLARINEELIAVCNFSDWNPSHFLDVAEMALGVSLALDWTRGKLPQSTIDLAKKSLIEKAIQPSWPKNGKVWHLSQGTNNWNQVCAGGLIAASIAVAEKDPGLAAKTIHRALEGLPNALVAYSPEGAYPEGSTYWGYATRFTVVTAAMLESAFGHDFGHYDYPGFRESAIFRSLCTAPSGKYFNYSDCGDKREKNGDETLAWFALKSGNVKLFEKERFLQSVEQMDRLSRFSGVAMAWISQFSESSSTDLPEAWKGEGTNPIAIFKSIESDPHQFYLGCKGGRASISHGNMDAGSFIFELNGIRWVLDPGNQGYYDLEKTGFDLWGKGQESDRWTLLTKNNFGHSSITVNNQPFLYDAFVPLIAFENKEKATVSFDLSEVYGDVITKAERTFTKDGRSSLLIEDELVITDKTELITWQLITTASVEFVEGGAILYQDGKELKIENISHPGLSFSMVSLDPPPMELDRQIEGLKRLELRIPAWTLDDNKTSITIRLSGAY